MKILRLTSDVESDHHVLHVAPELAPASAAAKGIRPSSVIPACNEMLNTDNSHH